MSTEIKHNRVVAVVRQGKKSCAMTEAKETDWQFILAGEGIGNGRRKKDVLVAFYLNADDQVIMTYPPQLLKQGTSPKEEEKN